MPGSFLSNVENVKTNGVLQGHRFKVRKLNEFGLYIQGKPTSSSHLAE